MIARFAIELNEILESERAFLPITDTRYRPDQRALEVLNLLFVQLDDKAV